MQAIFDNPKVDIHAPRYVRRGECNRCGQCCRNESCLNLEIVGNQAQCKAHPSATGADTREPKCGWFPQAPPILIEGCGYYFVDTWEDNRVLGPREV